MAFLGEYVVAILSVAGLLVAAWGAGGVVARNLPAAFQLPERSALRLLGGLGILGSALFLVGLRSFSPGPILAVLGVFFVWGAPQIFRARPPARWRPEPGLYVVMGLLLYLGLAALDLPSGTSDDVTYHLFGPKKWLLEHRILISLDLAQSAFPVVVETLFGALMSFANVRAAQLLTVVIAALFLLQLRGIARSLGATRKIGWLGVTLAATLPAIMSTVGQGYVDVAFSAFSLASFQVAIAAGPGGVFALAGLFAGLAVGTKYTGLVTAAVSFFLIGVATFTRVPRRRWVAGLLSFAGTAFVVGVPSYLRNARELGFPIYPPPPAFSRWFPVRAMSAEAIDGFHRMLLGWGGASFGKGVGDFLALPFRLTYFCERFGGVVGGLGIALLAFAPIGLWVNREKREFRYWTAWAGLVTVVWFLTEQEIRFLIHVLGVTAIFAAFGFEYVVAQTGRGGRAVATSLVALSVLHGLGTIGFMHARRIENVFEISRRSQNPLEGVLFAESYRYLNERAEVKKVLVINGAPRGYYFDKPFLRLLGEYGERPFPDVENFEAARAHLREWGITHVFDCDFHPGYFFGVTDPRGLTPVFEQPGARIYRVDGADL